MKFSHLVIAIAIVLVLLVQPFLGQLHRKLPGILTLPVIPLPFPRCSLSYRCRDCDADVPVGAGLPTIC